MDNIDDGRPISDDEIRQRLRRFAQDLRSYGLLGDSAATVGQDREAGSTALPSDGLAPMTRTVRQVDR